MSGGSTCSQCGFKTEQILLACPRCRRPLQHEQCKKCGCCPQHREVKQK